MWVRLRKGQLKGRKLIARDVKNKPNLEKILKSDIGYVDFKRMWISPDYCQQLKKNVFSMIWQLGPPTFFLTFTSAEKNWEPLTNTLFTLHKEHETKIGNLQTNLYCNNDITTFIFKDPIMCTHYYWHQIKSMRKLLTSDISFFGRINDLFSVTKFQNRGNEHNHLLVWVDNALMYGRESNIEIVTFVDT